MTPLSLAPDLALETPAPVPSLAEQVEAGLALAYQLREDARLRISRSNAPHARRLAVEEWALAAQAHAAYMLIYALKNPSLSLPPSLIRARAPVIEEDPTHHE